MTAFCLHKHQRGSGQLVNVGKSTILFSGNCSSETKEIVITATGVTKVTLEEKYLGLPTAIGRSSKEVFKYIPMQLSNFTVNAHVTLCL
jgi:hypothetical protein